METALSRCLALATQLVSIFWFDMVVDPNLHQNPRLLFASSPKLGFRVGFWTLPGQPSERDLISQVPKRFEGAVFLLFVFP